MTIARIGPDLLINNALADGQDLSTVVALQDGRFIASWTDRATDNIVARIFNADGTESVGQFTVSTFAAVEYTSGMAVLPDGRIVIHWTVNSGGDTSGRALYARIFNPDGTEAVPTFPVNTIGIGDQIDCSVTVLSDGRFVKSWTDYSNLIDDTESSAIRARIFNPDGTSSVPEFPVNQTTASFQGQSTVVALPDGGFVVSWTDQSNAGVDTSISAIRARIFNADGTQSVPELVVNTTASSVQQDSRIAALPDGRFLIAWNDSSQTGGDTFSNAIRARIFNADGSESVAEFVVNTTTASAQVAPEIAVLADGRIVMTWTDYSTQGADNFGGSIRARIFNADGTQAVPEFVVNTIITNDQYDSSLAALADGTFVVTWTDLSLLGGDASISSVGAQIFDPTRYSGTSVGDTVNGGALDDSYFGYGGADDLSGRDGDDYLNGGDGDDSLTGDAGDDTLDGGANGDNLYGGTGNDLLSGGSGNELMEGGDGNDTLMGGAAADQHIGGEGTDIASYADATVGLRADLANAATNTGSAVGDTYTSIEGLTGSSFSDVLVGSAIANRLDGGFGNDVLIGGQGADSLYGGAGTRDRVQYNDAAAGVRADLQVSSTNTGIAAGDTFSGVEDIFGSLHGDTLLGDTANNAIWGDAGNDAWLDGRIGNDTVYGGAGNDVLIGGWGADSLDGGAGARDRVQYTDSAAGIRVDIQVATFNTGVAAGDSYAGIEDIYGSFQGDTLLGDGGGNTIWGAAGNDVIDGRDGADTLIGGAGNDTLSGGAGVDVFLFETALGATNRDTVNSYSVADDTIQLENAIFTALAATGALAGTAFVTGAVATTAAHRIVYNSANGQLLYDVDGNGAGAAVLFATLSPGLALAAGEFLVV